MWWWQPLHGVLIVGFYFLTTWYLGTFNVNSNETWNWTCWYKVAWTFPTLYTLVSFIGLNIPDPCHETDQPNTVTIQICIVSKGTNLEALERTLAAFSWMHEQGRARLSVVIDDGPHVHSIQDMLHKTRLELQLVIVPKSFVTKHARYKSRALEYFRLHHIRNEDWILHMDEESTMDAHTFEKCLEFGTANTYDIGQGVILYNYCNYNLGTFTSKLITVADALRVADDLGRFRLQYHLLHRPIFGLHGSFLMIRGAVENKVTWDHEYAGNLTEDYAFAMQSLRLTPTIKCAPIGGVVREVSPQTLKDFMKQRRRWLMGILTLPYFWPRFMGMLWILGSFTFLATYLHIVLTLVWTYTYDTNLPLTPMWLGALSTFSFVTSIYMYALGLLIQHMDRMCIEKQKWFYCVIYIAIHFVLAVPLVVCASVLETACIYYSFIVRPKTFDVVRK